MHRRTYRKNYVFLGCKVTANRRIALLVKNAKRLLEKYNAFCETSARFACQPSTQNDLAAETDD